MKKPFVIELILAVGIISSLAYVLVSSESQQESQQEFTKIEYDYGAEGKYRMLCYVGVECIVTEVSEGNESAQKMSPFRIPYDVMLKERLDKPENMKRVLILAH